MQRFLSVVKKEFIHIKRDRASFVIAIMMPIVMMLLFGYAVNTELSDIKTGILDMSCSKESRELIKSFESSGYFKIDYRSNNIEALKDKMDKGEIHAGLIIPGDYDKKVSSGEKAEVQIIIDGSDPTTARTALSSGIMIATQKCNVISKEAFIKMGKNVSSGGLDVRTKVLYNPNLSNKNFTIPGLIGLIMQNITILLTAFALVRERERGNIELLIVSPLKSREIILGKLIPYILIGTFDFILSLFLGVYWFNVPVKGNMALLLLLGMGFVICSLAIGLLISTIAKTQLQAMQMCILILLPSVLLSGFVFPREAMPRIIQYLGYLLPLTYFLDILRGIILKGVSLSYLMNDVLLLLFLGVGLLILSINRFRAKL